MGKNPHEMTNLDRPHLFTWLNKLIWHMTIIIFRSIKILRKQGDLPTAKPTFIQ